MVKIPAAQSILNCSGASPDATKKVAVLVTRASCSGASHSSDLKAIGPKVNGLKEVCTARTPTKTEYSFKGM